MSASTHRRLPSLPSEEIRRRAADWWDRKIGSLVADRDPWHCVSIDVLTGEFEVAKEPLEAVDQLRARLPDAEIFTRRVGFPYVHRIGFHPLQRPVTLTQVEPEP